MPSEFHNRGFPDFFMGDRLSPLSKEGGLIDLDSLHSISGGSSLIRGGLRLRVAGGGLSARYAEEVQVSVTPQGDCVDHSRSGAGNAG